MSTANQISFLHTSDWHISITPPKSRAERGQKWLDAQAIPIRQIKKLKRKYDCSVLHTGDLFDSPNQPPELLNWLAEEMPYIIAIPGQHDLWNHRLDSLHKTAFWSMVEMGKVRYVDPIDPPLALGDLIIHSFPWNVDLKPNKEPPHTFAIHVAMIHKYLWTDDKGYHDAPTDAKLKTQLKLLKKYDVALFGDNHITVTYNTDRDKKNLPSVFNPGSLMRRHKDQKNHRPCVGLIDKYGKIKTHYLDCSRDRFKDIEDEMELKLDLSKFAQRAKSLKGRPTDYKEAVMEKLDRDKIDSGVREFVLKALEDKK